jgi:quercetin dioxygenase-like cupin family protein
VIILHDVEGLSMAEVADCLDITVRQQSLVRTGPTSFCATVSRGSCPAHRLASRWALKADKTLQQEAAMTHDATPQQGSKEAADEAAIRPFHAQRGDRTMRVGKLTGSIAAVLAALALGAAAGQAQEQEEVKIVFERAIPNIPGKSLIAQVVTYAPGGKSRSHRHAGSAFIYARVLSGAIRSQVDDEPVKVYRVGESRYENPGSHHRVSENASDREPASLLAIVVVDSKDKPLTTPDQK